MLALIETGPQVIAQEAFLEPVGGDGMAPTLTHTDYVLAVPCRRYEGEYLYVVENTNGMRRLVRAEPVWGSADKLRLWRDNEHYSEQVVRRAVFDRFVIGRVIADIKTRDPAAMAALGRRRQHDAGNSGEAEIVR